MSIFNLSSKNKNSFLHILGLVSIFFLCFLVMALRRPDIILNAQFWAEDGRVWFAEAYNHGVLASLLKPQNGYFQTISRLVLGFATFFPLEYVPIISNICALFFRAILIVFLFSSRFSWVGIFAKISILIYFLLMPGLDEVHANITNTHWYLALYLLMIIVADDASTGFWKIHDMLFLILSSLSGPFVLFIVPCLIYKYYYQLSIDKELRVKPFLDKLSNPFFILLFLLMVVQLLAVLSITEGDRSLTRLGASYTLFVHIVVSRIFTGFISPSFGAWLWQHDIFSFIIFIVCIGIIFSVCFNKTEWRARVIVIFSSLMLAAALYKPMLSLSLPQWSLLESFDSGGRYFIITNLCWCSLLIFFIQKYFRKYSRILFTLFFIGFMAISVSYFKIKPLPESHYAESISVFRNLQQGEKMDIPIAPGSTWFMTLIHK